MGCFWCKAPKTPHVYNQSRRFLKSLLFKFIAYQNCRAAGKQYSFPKCFKSDLSQIKYTCIVSRSEKYQRFYELVSRIPSGRVATYGQIATLSGYPGQARQVGYALNALPDDLEIPWQRVINAKGQISTRANPISEDIQRQILEAEGICFDSKDRIVLTQYLWKPGNS